MKSFGPTGEGYDCLSPLCRDYTSHKQIASVCEVALHNDDDNDYDNANDNDNNNITRTTAAATTTTINK